jgi:hypothetical protein
MLYAAKGSHSWPIRPRSESRSYEHCRMKRSYRRSLGLAAKVARPNANRGEGRKRASPRVSTSTRRLSCPSLPIAKRAGDRASEHMPDEGRGRPAGAFDQLAEPGQHAVSIQHLVRSRG